MRIPVCLVPAVLAPQLKPQLEDLFSVQVFDAAEEAWCMAEEGPVDLIVTGERIVTDNLKGLLTGLKVLHPEMIHLHIVEMPDTSGLIDLINVSSRMRVVRSTELEEGVKAAGADVFSMIISSQKKDELIEKLKLENEQFEFMLRQSLLIE